MASLRRMASPKLFWIHKPVSIHSPLLNRKNVSMCGVKVRVRLVGANWMAVKSHFFSCIQHCLVDFRQATNTHAHSQNLHHVSLPREHYSRVLIIGRGKNFKSHFIRIKSVFSINSRSATLPHKELHPHWETSLSQVLSKSVLKQPTKLIIETRLNASENTADKIRFLKNILVYLFIYLFICQRQILTSTLLEVL